MPDDVAPLATSFEYCPSPVFIIGAPRSGTTALARALVRHTAFYAGDETFFLWELFGGGRPEEAYRRWAGRPSSSWLRRERVGEESFLAALGLGINALLTTGSDGRRWIDHTPVHALMADTLAAMFPGAQFLHILRDGREVVNSMLNLERTLPGDRLEQMKQAEFLPDWARDFRRACETWRDHVRAAADFGRRHPARCLTVAHRALERTPAIAMAGILRFLGEPYEEQPVEFLNRHRINSSFTPPGGCAAREYRRPDPRASWSVEQCEMFEAVAGADMIDLGLAADGKHTPPAAPTATGRPSP